MALAHYRLRVGATAGLPATSTPAWRAAMSARTWAEVGSNTIADINPRYDPAVNPSYALGNDGPWMGINGGPQSVVTASWNGGVWNDSILEYNHGPAGGHGDRAGNESYLWRGYLDTPSFVMPKPPSTAIGYELPSGTLEDDEATGKYTDGRVRSYHTYGNFAIRAGVAWFFGGSSYASGVGPNRFWRWQTDDWVDESEATYVGNVATGAAYDSSRDLFWIVGGGASGITSYNPTSKSKTEYAASMGSSSAYGIPLYLPANDGLVVFKSDGTDSGARFVYFPLSGTSGYASQSAVSPTVSGTPPTENSRGSGIWGVAYDSLRTRLLVWWGGTTVYILTPPADPVSGAWAWSTLTPVSGSVDPGAPTERGIYGRFWFSETLNCCGVFNDVTQKMQVFALEN